MAKWIAIILGFLLLTSNAFWLYGAIDLAVTEAYRQQEEYELKNYSNALKKICNNFLTGMPKSEAVALMKTLNPEEEPWEKEGTLNSGWLVFHLSESGETVSQEACK